MAIPLTRSPGLPDKARWGQAPYVVGYLQKARCASRYPDAGIARGQGPQAVAHGAFEGLPGFVLDVPAAGT